MGSAAAGRKAAAECAAGQPRAGARYRAAAGEEGGRQSEGRMVGVVWAGVCRCRCSAVKARQSETNRAAARIHIACHDIPSTAERNEGHAQAIHHRAAGERRKAGVRVATRAAAVRRQRGQAR